MYESGMMGKVDGEANAFFVSFSFCLDVIIVFDAGRFSGLAGSVVVVVVVLHVVVKIVQSVSWATKGSSHVLDQWIV